MQASQLDQVAGIVTGDIETGIEAARLPARASQD